MRWQNHPLRTQLISPDTLLPLEWEDEHSLVTSAGERFAVEQDIPVLMPSQLDHAERHFLEHYCRDAELFDYWEKRDRATAHDEQRVHEVILRHIPRHSHLVLDVGCGNGWLSRALVQRGVAVCSLDASTINPRRALECVPHERHVAVVGLSQHLPFADSTFDCAVASEVIEHLPEPERALEEMLRVVRPGGRVLISTPYRENIRYVLCIHCNQPTPIHAHLNSFDEHRLAQYLRGKARDYGFSIFGNKALLVLRTHVLLQWLPHWLWHAVDWCTNRIIPKPAHIVAWWDK